MHGNENSEIEKIKIKTNKLEKLMNMNYNYISCINSKKKPDIYIGDKAISAKKYRFQDKKAKSCNIDKPEEGENNIKDIEKNNSMSLEREKKDFENNKENSKSEKSKENILESDGKFLFFPLKIKKMINTIPIQ